MQIYSNINAYPILIYEFAQLKVILTCKSFLKIRTKTVVVMELFEYFYYLFFCIDHMK